MRFFRQLLDEASSLFFLGVGVSGMRKIERELDPAGIPSDGRWRVSGLRAEVSEHRGERAVLLECADHDGLAWLEDLQFAEGEIRIDWASGAGSMGIALDVRDRERFDLIRFSSQRSGSWTVEFVSALSGASERQIVAELNGVDLDWVRLKIVIQKDRIAVIINDHNIPCLRVSDYRPGPPGGSIGFWLGRGSSCYFTNLKCVEIRKQIRI